MKIIQINKNTWRIEDSMVRFFLLTGSESALLIDSGFSAPNAKALAQSITSLPIRLLNTHGDGDHTTGNGCFDCFYMVDSDYDNCNLADKFPASKHISLHDGDTIDLGSRQLEIITIPGHTFGSVAVLDRNNRVLFSGDSVQSGFIYMFGGHRNPAAFAASLEKLMGRTAEFDFIYPSHSAPILPASYIRDIADAWQAVSSGALEARRENLHGNPVDTYTTSVCGFYCNPKE